ncbi:hypothetical protein ACSDR0_43890 [Streptosporangium sp. G11]|uniref:hypothetical protein n=1 Tax=Streptosporangium sp. G11 TaxID=3436926 RepID=UPI003EBA885F
MFRRPYTPRNYPDHVTAFEEFVTSSAGRQLLDEHLAETADEQELLPIPPLGKPNYRKAFQELLKEDLCSDILERYFEITGDLRARLQLEDLHRQVRDSYEPVTYSPIEVGKPEELDRLIYSRFKKAPKSSVLVSVLFTQPQSIVYKDLRRNHAYLDVRSGLSWDLYIAGYEKSPILNRWRFDSSGFNQIREYVESEHEAAMASSGPLMIGDSPWRFSGTADLVSFMAYPGEYHMQYDWLSLRALRLLDANDRYIKYSLGEIVEELSDWQEADSPVLRELAPGEIVSSPASTLSLQPFMKAGAATLIGGIAVNAAYDLIKQLMTN